jgi:hypothetical protein
MILKLYVEYVKVTRGVAGLYVHEKVEKLVKLA